MTGFDRRQVLASAGVGATAGLTGLATGDQKNPDTGQAVAATFTATVDSGFIVIDGASENDDNATANVSIENLDGTVELAGEIYEDRTWQADEISFPDVDPGEFIDPEDIDAAPVEDISFDGSSIDVVVDEIAGVYDPDADAGPLVTGTTSMLIEADISGEAEVDLVGGIEVPFEFNFDLDINAGEELTLTSEESQALTGAAATLGCADPVVRVVNNEFTVPEAEPRDPGGVEECVEDIVCIDVNETLELPSADPTRNFIELDLDIEWVDTQPFAPDPVVGDQRPRDLDCDGNYEDIDGDGELTIFDVQALFEHRNDEQLEANADLFDFAGTGGDRVSIFDVQSLYDRLQNRD